MDETNGDSATVMGADSKGIFQLVVFDLSQRKNLGEIVASTVHEIGGIGLLNGAAGNYGEKIKRREQ